MNYHRSVTSDLFLIFGMKE